jgi:hypothetical protein
VRQLTRQHRLQPSEQQCSSERRDVPHGAGSRQARKPPALVASISASVALISTIWRLFSPSKSNMVPQMFVPNWQSLPLVQKLQHKCFPKIHRRLLFDRKLARAQRCKAACWKSTHGRSRQCAHTIHATANAQRAGRRSLSCPPPCAVRMRTCECILHVLKPNQPENPNLAHMNCTLLYDFNMHKHTH